MKNLIRTLSVFTTKRGAISACKWRPFSITSFDITHRLKDAGFDFATIIDGGSNKGQFARACAETWRYAKIYSYEPLPDIAKILRKNLRDLGERIVINEVALGANKGQVTFHKTPYTLQSSALEPIHTTYENIPVCQDRLDNLLKDTELASPILVKLDLQGYELEALKGANHIIRKADAVLLEVSFDPGYHGEASFESLRSFLATYGFVFNRPLDVLWQNNHITQMDTLFVRDSESE